MVGTYEMALGMGLDGTQWPGVEIVLQNWREEMEIVLSALLGRRQKVWDKVLGEAGDRLFSTGGRVYLDPHWGQGKKGRPRDDFL